MTPDLDASTLISSLLFSLLQMGVTITVLVAAIMNWKVLRAWFRPGLHLGAAVLVLSLPGAVATVLFMDASAMLPAGSTMPPGPFTQIMHGVMAVMTAGTLVLTFFFTALQVGVGELAVAGAAGEGGVAGPRAYPWLLGGRQETGGWKLAAAYGLAAGLLSALLFWALDVKAGAALELVKRLFPKLAALELPMSLTVMVPAVLLAAVTEELLFRGLLQGWLTRWLGGSGRAVAISIGVSSALWALAHWGNTDQPWLKLGQVFLYGLGLGALTRRYSVEASIVSHALFNLVAVGACVVLGG